MIIKPNPTDAWFRPPISKREYQEAMFRNCLDPNMNEWDKHVEIMKFFYRKDEDVAVALIDRPDEEVRREAFLMSLYDAINTDDEIFDKRAIAVWKALESNNAQQLLIALCGWNSGSIAKRAGLIPDDGYDFFDEENSAVMHVHWSNGQTTTAKCTVDVASNKLYGYRRKVLSAYSGEAEITSVEVEVKPCFGKRKYFFNCITKEEREEQKDFVSYWYSTNPDEDRDPAPQLCVENPYK